MGWISGKDHTRSLGCECFHFNEPELLAFIAPAVNSEWMPAKSDYDDVVRIAEFLVNEAKRRNLTASQLSEKANLDKSYLSKAKTRKIKQIPLETLAALARVLGCTAESIYQDLNFPLPAAINQRQREGQDAAGVDEFEVLQEVEIRSVNSIPDHSWPLVAAGRGLFQDAGLEVDTTLSPLSRYPEDYNEICDGSATTAFVASLQALKDFTHQKFTAVAFTHTYKGFAAIARTGSSMNFLKDDAGLSDLKAFVTKLIVDEVIPSENSSHHYLSLLDEPARQFVRLVLEMATQTHPMPFESNADLSRLQPSPSGKTGLEALNRIGPGGRDLAVGHVLSLAMAFSDPAHFQIAIDYDHIEAIAQELDGKSHQTTRTWRDRVQRLNLPVAFVFNAANLDFAEKLDETHHAKEILALRLAAIAYHASATLFTSMSQSTVRELLRWLDLPNDHKIDAEHLLRSWRKAYHFNTMDHAAGLIEMQMAELEGSESRMRRILEGAKGILDRLLLERDRARVLIDELQKRELTEASKRLLDLAHRQFRNLNYYDASRLAAQAQRL